MNTVLALLFSGVAVAKDNGLARLPPMGWRSWNLYGGDVNQTLIETIIAGMVRRTREVDGKLMSLCDLGYCSVGLDDNWQVCKYDSAGDGHYHDNDGNPLINYKKFPNMRNMTDYAHKLGLRAGWYGNNCICSDDSTAFVKYYIGDLRAFRELGFDSWKLDGCSAQLDMQLWDMLIDSDGGKPIEVENCHWGGRGRSIPSDPRAIPYEPTQTWCPWNMYRSSGDVRSNYGSIIGNLNSVTNFSARNLSYPGCWAYADMLEVGCHHGPGGEEDSGLSFIEARSHFGSWAIVSSPLTLSHDVNNDTVMDAIWPIISNREVIAVSQSYAGFSGGPFKVHNHMVSLSDINHAAVHKSMTEEEKINLGPYTAPKFQYFYKPLEFNGAKTAVLLMNHDNVEQDMLLNFADIPGVKCTQCHVRDIWNHKDLGNFNASIKATNVTSHDSVFLIITPAQNVQQQLLMRDMWVV